LGDMKSAFTSLERGVQEFDEEADEWMNANPAYDQFRSDPRWQKLVEKEGLNSVN